MDPDLKRRAEALRALHVPGAPLVLPNAWDVTSAKVFEDAGFPAVATSSSAVARTLGYPDGERIPADDMFAAVARIAASVVVPVTADVERGYGLDPAELVERLVSAGAVGCNLEDSDARSEELVDLDTHASWLARVRETADAAGAPIVLNTRVDVHLREWGTEVTRMAEAVARAIAYRAAGADCVYPIGLKNLADIEEFNWLVDSPVNVVFRPGGPSLADLARVGIARVSFGGGLHQAVQHRLRSIASAIREGRDPYAGITG